jgi:hypothetical protein
MLSNLLKAVGIGKAPEFVVPATLPKLGSLTSAELLKRAGLALPPGASPTMPVPELLSHVLNSRQDPVTATKLLANGLPQKEGVKWAADSARMVESKLPPLQKEALKAADAFDANPTAGTRDEARKRAKAAGPNGPGSLAAEAAGVSDVPGTEPVPERASVQPAMVAGAVMVAASIAPPAVKVMPDFPVATAAPPLPDPPSKPLAPVPPPDPGSSAAIKTCQTYKPFVDRGLALAAS